MEPTYTSSPVSEELRKLEEIVNEVGDKSPYEIFSLYIDSEMLSQIVTFSNKYAQDNNHHSFHLTTTELKQEGGKVQLFINARNVTYTYILTAFVHFTRAE